jgi:hypothetical protein
MFPAPTAENTELNGVARILLIFNLEAIPQQ